MAYADIGDKSTGDRFTEAMWDQIRANFQAGVPDIFTAKGDLAAATAADTAARLPVGANYSELTPLSSEATGLKWQIRPACRVTNDAAIDPTINTWVTLTFNTERYDTDGAHSTSTNTSRLTVPTGGDGIYEIGACIEFDTTAQNPTLGVRLLLNGTTVLAQVLGSYTGGGHALTVTTHYDLDAADYVEVQAYTTSDINVVASANYSPEFWMTFLRPN